jgi:uncharacterized repeat protein (TIGR01451 family)
MRSRTEHARPQPSPRAVRLAIIALATLILCSCQSLPRGGTTATGDCPAGTGAPGVLATDGGTGPVIVSDPNMVPQSPFAPLPITVVGNWAPPGLEYPWPMDEYVRDGGDAALPTEVAPDWSVTGLDVEDTVGHFDTLDGRTIVEPSNPVYIYTPRFGSVRSVAAIVSDEQIASLGHAHQPVHVVVNETDQPAVPRYQAVQAVTDIAARQPGALIGPQFGAAVSQRLMPYSFEAGFLPYEALQVIRQGVFERTENARLAERIEAAITWSSDQAVQVMIDSEIAHEVAIEQKPEITYFVKEPDSPRLRVIKVASTPIALPGDTVAFTIRFDNVGDQVMGNVTILDNLSPRLEYVEGSAQASVEADFSHELNDAGSLVLRWEVIDPLEAGDGGLVRFKCRVR